MSRISVSLASACGIALALSLPVNGVAGPKSGGSKGGSTTTTTTTSTDYTVSGSVSGGAYGALVDLHALLGLVGVRVGPIPQVTLPASGGLEAETLLGLSVPGIISSATLPALTVGAVGPHAAGSTSVATVENLDVLDGLITADAIVALCSSWGNGSIAVTGGEGSSLVNLVIAGNTIAANPEPNTKIPLLDGFLKIGDVILNEQVYSGDGVHTSAVDVNMLHVKLADGGVLLNGQLLSGDIVVSSAHCDVDASLVPGTPGGVDGGFMTGGGKIGQGKSFATFGFDARQGSGELQYIDHGTGLKIHGTSVTSFSISGNCAEFSGPAKKDNVDGYTYDVQACDNGEPGVGADTFSITATGPNGFSYTRSGTLSGGNLQLH